MALAILMVILVGGQPAQAGSPAPTVIQSAAMFPAFSPNQSDYGLGNCVSKTTTLTFKGPGPFSVNGKRVKSSWRGKTAADQILTIVIGNGAGKKFFVRCLPDDFPRIDFTGKSTSGYYLIPYESGNVRYYIVTDSAGVPIWYRRADSQPTNIVAMNGAILTQSATKEALRASGKNVISVTSLAGTTTTFNSGDGVKLDAHHFEVTPKGGLLALGAEFRPMGSLDGFILGANALTGECPISPVDPIAVAAQVLEYDKSGKVTWTWNALDHISKKETLAVPYLLEPEAGAKDGCAADIHHINWAQFSPDGKSAMVSLYTAGAVFNIDHATGDVRWKIGGVRSDKSLTIIGDPLSQPAGFHGGELLADGTLVLFDNRKLANEPGRGVLYKIDELERTATFIRSFTPPTQPCTTNSGTVYCPSWAMGGISATNANEFLVSWGDKFHNVNVATVFDRNGKVLTDITDPTSRATIYRVGWAPSSAWDRSKLRTAASSTRTLP